MLFPTIEFAVFFTVVLTVSWLLMPHRVPWKLFVLAASYFFYSYADTRFVLLLASSTVFNQVMAELVFRAPGERLRRALLVAAVAGDLVVLGWFKYYGFFLDTVTRVLGSVGLQPPLPLLQVVLPVGISFYTFMALSYVVDVHRRSIRPASPLDFAVYLAFFPHLVAGPIVRASEFVPQLATARDPRQVPAARAFGLIAGGLVKKVVIADVLATHLVDPVFALPSEHSSGEVLAAIYGYAVQIFCDFSAYSDMAIGLALLLGFRFPDNFDRPYTALSLQDFWRRWHMSLSRWLRDYLYVPLGGNRGGPARTRRNLLLTMLLGGLWHGAAWNFVLWGGLHGGGLAAERSWLARRGRPLHPVLGWLLTFHLVCLAWVFFRADGLGTALTVLGRLFTGPGPAPLVTAPVLLAIAAGLGIQFLPRTVNLRAHAVFARWGMAAQGLALGGVIVLADALGSQGVAPFIYFRF